MEYPYYCLVCGKRLLTSDDALIDIAPIVYDGAVETQLRNWRLLITKSKLEELINRRHQIYQCPYISIAEVITIAYEQRNAGYLNPNNCTNHAGEAIRAFSQSKSEWKKRVEENDPDGNGSSEDIIDFVSLPGFFKQQKAQLLANFRDGICLFNIEPNPTYGYIARVNMPGMDRRKLVGKRYCPECGKMIVEQAFVSKMVRVGMIGFKSVGKTCLITSLCYDLCERGGELMGEESQKTHIANNMNNYIKGKEVPKTEESGLNLCNPAVFYKNLIWNFVDIAGESFFSDDNEQLDMGKILNRFPGILECDTYVICTSEPVFRETGAFGVMQHSINTFLSELKARHDLIPPMIFTVTQIDEQEAQQQNNRTAEGMEYNPDYNRLYQKEYKYISKQWPKLKQFMLELAKRAYLTPLTCSAYGFKPYSIDAQESRIPEPKRIKLIIDWIACIIGRKKILSKQDDDVDYRNDWTQMSRSEYHMDENEIKAITKMFCNPNDYDLKRYDLIGGGPMDQIKIAKLEREIAIRKRKNLTADSQDE